MRPLIAFLALVLAGCASPAMNANLSLHERFVLTALTNDDGDPVDSLWRWDLPVMVRYDGPERFRQDVANHLDHLGEITGLWVIMDADHPNTLVEISDRDTPSTCRVQYQRDMIDIHIWSALPDAHVRRCILQELAQAIGPGGDLDGLFGSRSDTVFASYQTADWLTPEDIAILRIMYSDRLHHGMPRERVLAVLPEIIADLYPELEASGR